MGLYKEMPWSQLWRGAKTFFFLLNMLASLLFVCAPPLLVVLLDILLPSALLSSSSTAAIFSQPKRYKFATSLVDMPLMSIIRSLLILSAYAICEGQGAYFGIAAVCSFGSIGFVSTKAVFVLVTGTATAQGRHLPEVGGSEGSAMGVLFLCSLGLAVAHVVVAYRTRCREQRKLIVHRIDIEALKLKDMRLQ